MHLVIKLDAVHLADTIEQKRKQSKRGTEGQVNRMAEYEYITKMEKDMGYIPKGELIRCKDCEYGEQDEVGRWFCRSLGCQIGSEDGSGYCADAERRSE